MSQRFKIRYKFERGDFAKPSGTLIREGIRVSDDDNGYADEVFVASIIHPGTEDESILLLSSEERQEGQPSREMLLKIRAQIDHYLEHHS